MTKTLIGSLIGAILICIGCSTIPQTTEMSIRQLLKNASEGDAIILPNTKIDITSPIVISKSNIALVGDTNTILSLSSNVNCPVIVVGVQGRPVISNVVIMNIQIDGNRTNQSNEFWKNSLLGYPMYNNGVIVQNSKDILISDMVIHNCISGGLVSTFGVSQLVVSNLVAFNNQFDGLACYQTTNSVFLNLLLFNNVAAGISLDMHFNENIFYNVFLVSNTIGIFIRNSHDNKFNKIRMIGNTQYDVFIASVNNKTNTGCVNNVFTIHGDGEIHNDDPLCVSNVFKRRLGN